MNNKFTIYILAAALILVSCSHKNETEIDNNTDLIGITEEQFRTGNMAIGEPLNMQFDELIRCSGTIVVEPSGTIMISSSIPALVKKINCREGTNVNAGQLLFELSGNDFVELQKDYAETLSQLIRIKSEYERLKSLFEEKIGSEKDFIMAESEYNVANAKYSALKMKIKMLGLDETKISDGNYYGSFSIRSPIKGYLSQINVAVGQYADQQTPLAEMLDINTLELRIAVFEKDLDKLKENQKINFNMIGNTDSIFTARIKSIGRNVELDSKTILCYADIDDPGKANLVNNAFAEAAIITKSDFVKAVPEEAILKSEGDSYLLEVVKNENGNYFLKKIKVSPGRLYNGFIELLQMPEIDKIITKGAYNIVIE